MKIKQSDISSDMNFRTRLLQYDGIKAFKMENDWYWKIEPTIIEWNVLEKQLAPHYSKEIKKLRQLLEITEIPHFSDLFDDISKTIAPPKKQYKVEGDIHDAYTTGTLNIYTLMDNQNLRQTIRVVTHIGKIPPTEFLNKRVVVIGELDIYRPYALFQLKTDETKIQILGNCSRMQKVAAWAEELKEILQASKPIEYKPFKRIGVIGQESSRGTTDFKGHLKPVAKKEVEYEYKLVPSSNPLNTETIMQYLTEFNENAKNPCDYICIVRGGGDSEMLLQYSQPDFVRAIARSKIPVITGIAHDEDIDVLLCDQAVALNLNGKTPTGAAEKLNEIAGTVQKRKREQEYNKRLENIIHKTNDDKKRIALLEQECKELKQRVDELQEEKEHLQQQLDASKKKGFFARLFS